MLPAVAGSAVLVDDGCSAWSTLDADSAAVPSLSSSAFDSGWHLASFPAPGETRSRFWSPIDRCHRRASSGERVHTMKSLTIDSSCRQND